MSPATEVARLVVRLVADINQYKAQFVHAQNVAKGMVNVVGSKIKNLGDKLSQFGRTMNRRVTLPLVGVATAGIIAFSSFDSQMTKSTSIMQVTQEQTERMRDAAKALAREGPQGPAELAEAYFFLASAGKNAEQSIKLLPVVQKFATAGAFDMALATDLLTDAQSALGMTSKDLMKDQENMTKLSDVLVKANTLANASVQQFSEALTNDAGPTMKNFNIQLEEGVAVLAAYADQGIKGNEAGSMFGRMLRLLTGSALENAAAFEEMNISVFDSATGQLRLTGAIEDLQRELGHLSPEMKVVRLEQLGFNALAQKAILPLIGATDAIKGYNNALKDAGHTTGDVASKQMESLANKINVLKNEFKLLMIEIGERLLPFFEKLMEKIREGLAWWDALDESTKNQIIQWGVWLAAVGPIIAVVGTLISLFGTLVTTIGTLINPWTIMVGLAVALGVALAKLWHWFAGTEEKAKATAKEINKIVAAAKALQEQVDKQRGAFFNKVASESDPEKRLKMLMEEKRAVTELAAKESERINLLFKANLEKQKSGNLSAQEIASYNMQNEAVKSLQAHAKQVSEEYQRQWQLLNDQEEMQNKIRDQIAQHAKEISNEKPVEIPVEFKAKAEQIRDAIKTPFERAQEEIKAARILFDAGEINMSELSLYTSQIIDDFVQNAQMEADDAGIEFTPSFGPLEGVGAKGSAAFTRIDQQQFEIKSQKDLAAKKDTNQTPEQKSLASIDDKTKKMVDKLEELIGVQRDQEEFASADF